ncbi:cytochrome P450 4B1-like isoform X2 [Hemibagrus wyckioides]|uniref:cytochrome P450 4B1-like isoform X2 n=1 Tax=Hemibagrus wyckioides TaxID=337641 RepID=UPI00266C9FE1|nr:cytochrome P450 4B1-like isoform X2 [Hemibagrus wyckioides]
MGLFNYVAKLTPFNMEAFRFYHVFAVVCIIYISAVLIKWSIKRNRWIRALEQFPGPPGHWLLGHVPEFKGDGTDMGKIPKWGEQYPFAFPMQFSPDILFLFVHHPSYVKPILATTGPKDDFGYRFLIPWIGQGLLVTDGQKWFRHRRLLTPGFHYDILKPYVNIMADSAKVMLDKWEAYAKTGQTFELFQHVSLMTLDSIMKCAFSCQSNCQTERTNPYIKAVYELCYLVNLRFRVFPYHNDIIFHLSPHGYRYRRACKIAHTHTEEVIRQRREILNNNKKNQDDAQKKRYLDFLDILLCAQDEQQQGLSDEAIRAEVDTFMFGGHDTTGSAISWIFYNMACNPEHQQKCREEIQQVLMGKDTIQWEDLSKIPYTTMCIKESLRICPPVPLMGRKLSQPMTFFDGRTAPAGCVIGISIYGIHHNPTVWENPKVFDPLRFLPENTAKRSPHAFVPFSAGPRNCIGQNFAMNEMKVVVALTLRKYVLIKDPDHTPEMVPRIVLRSLNGIHLKIKLVEHEL